MTKLSKTLLFAAASLSLAAGPAFADGDDAAAGGGDAAGAPAPMPDPNAGGAAPAPAGDAGGGGWTQEIITRPRTLEKGMLDAHLALSVAKVSVTVGMVTASATGEGLSLGAAYGVSEKIEAGVDYGFSLHDFEIKGPLSLHGAYRLMSGKLSAAADAKFSYDLNAKASDLALGANVQFNVAPKIAVYTPGYQLGVGLSRDMGSAPIVLGLPFGVALQATPNVYAFVQSTIGDISISNSANAFLFADFVPLTVGAFFSPSNKMDLGVAVVLPDAKHAGDIWGLQAVARIFKFQ